MNTTDEYDPNEDDAEEYAEQMGGGRRFLHQVGTLARMAKAVAKGDYELALPKIALMLGTLGYVVSPVDLIPDVLPIVGLTDDVSLTAATIAAMGYEIALFREWEHEQGLP